MTEQRVSFRYARAVIDAAAKDGIADTIYKDFQVVQEFINSSKEFKTIMRSPVVPEHKKSEIIKTLFANRITDVSMNFFLFLVKKGRSNYMNDIIVQYNDQYDIMNNRLRIDVTSALELNEELKSKLIQKISDLTQKSIIPNYHIDSTVKGGMIIKVNDWVFDATLRNQLKNLFKTLAA